MTTDRILLIVTMKFWELVRSLDDSHVRRLLAQIGMVCVAFRRGHENRTAELLRTFWNEVDPQAVDDWPEIFDLDD